MQPSIINGFGILAHASDSMCLGLWSLCIGSAGRRSVVCGACSSLSHLLPSLPSIFLCLSM